LDHLIRAHEAGLAVSPSWLIDEASLAWLAENLTEDGDSRPLMEKLPPPLTAKLVSLFTKCRATSSNAVRSQA
jgi:hypothetical protein